MGSPTVKEILIKWNMDVSSWKNVISQMASMLDKANAANQKAMDFALESLEKEQEAVQDIVEGLKQETVELEKQVEIIADRNQAAATEKAAATARLTSEKAVAAEASAQIKNQQLLQSIQRTIQQEVNTKLANERLVTAELNKQAAAVRLQMTQQKAGGAGGGTGGTGAGGGGGGGGGGALGGFAQGLLGGFGSKFAGTMTFAVTAGELLKDTLEHIAESLKELILESDSFTNIWRTFGQLAKNMGQDPEKMIEGLSEATHGLVSTTKLASESMRVMMQSLPITSGEIKTLTRDVADLARVQGRDATEAMAALNRGLATGRLNMVAYQLGLENTIRNQLALTAQLPASARAFVEYGIVADAVKSKLEETGRPIETLGTAVQRLGVSWGDFLEDVASATVKTEGAKELQNILDEISKALKDNKGFINELASAIGSFLGIVADLIKFVQQVKKDFDGLNTSLGASTISAGKFVETEKEVASILALLTLLYRELALATSLAAKEGKDFLSLDFEQALKDEEQYFNNTTKAVNDYAKAALAIATGTRATVAGGGTEEDSSTEAEKALRAKQKAALEDFQYNTKLAKEWAEVQKLQEDRALETLKGNLAQRGQLYSQLYQSGAMSFKDFIEEQKSSRIEETNLEIANLEKQKKAQEALYNREKVLTGLQIERTQLQLKGPLPEKDRETAQAGLAMLQKIQRDAGVGNEKIELEYDNKILAARNKLAKDLMSLAFQLNKDEIEAYKATVSEMEKMDKSIIDNRKMLTENSFKLAEISASRYLDNRIELIDAEYEAEIKAAKQAAAFVEDKQQAQVQLQAKTADAAMKREKELTQLQIQEWDIRTKAAEAAFARVQSLLEEQLKFAKTITPGDEVTGLGQQQAALKSIIELERQRLAYEHQQLGTVKEGNARWYEVQGNIVKSQEALVRYNLELIKAQDYVTVIAQHVKTLGTVAEMFPKGGRTAEALGKGAQFLEQSQQLINAFRERIATQAGEAKKPVTPEEIFASLKTVADETGQDLKSVGQAYTESAAQVTTLKEAMQVTEDGFKVTIPAAIAGTIEALAKFTTALELPFGKGYGTPEKEPFSVVPEGSYGAPGSPSGISYGQSQATTTAAEQVASVGQSADAMVTSFDKVIAVLNKFSGGILGTMLGSEGLVGVFQNLGKNTKEASKDFGNFMSGIQAISGLVAGVMQTFKAVGAGQGAIQGAMSFAQIGNAIAGPIGGIVGAIAGAITGAISGSMREATQKMAERMAAAFKAVIQEVQSGTQTLGAAVTLEINNIEQAVQSLSGRKGGRDQLKQILPDMEAQLAQLQQQQKQIIQSMDQQLNVLNAPEAYQQQLQSIDSIIQKYTQYIQAGGSVANANQFLQDSFHNLAVQGIQQLNQDEQDAINNALQYNDLLLQRQNLIQDTNQQIQDIMSQGVAVRQMPAGVTKARQIQELMRNATIQMDQMNQEIAVSQHKLDNEQKIFNLATTRIGLENQLVQLQNEQTDIQTQQVLALGNVVGALQTALPTSMPAALLELGLGAGYVSPGTELGLQPVPPVKTGIATIDLQNQLMYQQQLAAWQLSQNIPIGFIAPSGTVTTTTVPATIGPATTYTGGSLNATVPQQTWLTPGSTSLLGTAAAGATSLISATSAINQLPSSVMSSLGQVGTVSTQSGTALLVTPVSSMSVSAPSVLAPPGSPSNPMQGVGGILRVSPTAPRLVAQAAIENQTQVNNLVSSAAQRQTIEQNITSLSTVRVASETQLVSLKMNEIRADMQRVQAHAQLLQASKSGGAVPNTLEDLMQNVYETRGRQGYGGFYGETNNAF